MLHLCDFGADQQASLSTEKTSQGLLLQPVNLDHSADGDNEDEENNDNVHTASNDGDIQAPHNILTDVLSSSLTRRRTPKSSSINKGLVYCHAPNQPSSSSHDASTSALRTRPGKVRNAPPPRNIQTDLTCATTTKELLRLDFRCPVPGCKYTPTHERRMADFQRHLRTHQPKRQVCKGVPVSQAGEYIIDSNNAIPYMVEGDEEELYVGGCMASFSQSDALKRHIEKSQSKCVSLIQKKPMQ